MSLADLVSVMEKTFTIEEFKNKDGEPIQVTVRPITLNKARKMVENYGIFIEELIFNKIELDKIDQTEYVRNFGMEKADEAISYIIAVALDEEDFMETIHIDLPWHTKLELLNAIVELSLPKDKKKAQEAIEKIMILMMEPLLKILSVESWQENSNNNEQNNNKDK